MLSFFRQNHFIRSLFLLFYCIAVKAPLFFYPEPNLDSGGFLSDLIFGEVSKIVAIILSILLTFLASVYLNKIIIENRITRESTLIPGMLLITLTGIAPEFSSLSAPLLGLLPFIISVDYLMLLYKKTEYSGKVFNMGFWISMASLFYFPYLYFAVFLFIGISILKFIRISDILRLILGMLTPYLFALYYFIWQGDYSNIGALLFGKFFGRFGIPIPISFEYSMKILLVVLVIIIGVFNYGQYIKKKNVQSINKIDVIYWGSLVAGLTILIATPLTINHLIISLPFVASILAMSFLNMSNIVVAEIVHLLILGFGFYLHYITFV